MWDGSMMRFDAKFIDGEEQVMTGATKLYVVTVYSIGTATISRYRGDSMLWSQGIPKECSASDILDRSFCADAKWLNRFDETIEFARRVAR